MTRECGFEGCANDATVYGGWPNHNDWACYACTDCAEKTPGFQIWDRLALLPPKTLGVLFP